MIKARKVKKLTPILARAKTGIIYQYRYSNIGKKSEIIVFTCVSYAEARNRYRLDVRLSVCQSVRPSVRLSVRHTLALYQKG